ncbi:hypothetical protein QBC41DRAFT_135537 [Cercophora samala]|uniref:BTB domain-containing protein n=1 Tax=Cercophora samala TaxID=330535 RepID=A0AA40DGB0_9PEZI|nr:hypothetical protein QBC41DRAFT_135537 [Cercophora samala]
MAGAASASNIDAAAEQSGVGARPSVISNGEGSSSSPATLDHHGAGAELTPGSGSGSGSRSTSASVPGSGSGSVRTLEDVMKEPSTNVPDVVVLNALPEPRLRRDTLDPKQDLWMSTADGRYNSPIIPLKVGSSPNVETFYVHKHILIKYEYFEKALCGSFRESETQSIELPEEDPAIFHFLVSYFYEGRYDPIKPLAAVLIPDQPKGKDPEHEISNAANTSTNAGADSDSDRSLSSLESDVSTISRRRRDRRIRRAERQYERLRQKHPGHHRTNCPCPSCSNVQAGPACWSCRAPRLPPPPPPPPGAIHPNVLLMNGGPGPGRPPPPGHPAHHRRRNANRRGPHPPLPPPPPTLPPSVNTNPNPRLPTPADLQTWLLTYNLSVSVYISASKFLLEPLKRCVARHIIDLLESAGPDCASLELLYSCSTLYTNLPSYDPLLKMVFARVAFLQCWKLPGSLSREGEGDRYLVENPEIAALLLKEMASRTEDGGLGGGGVGSWMVVGQDGGRMLPSMERVGDGWADGVRNGGGMVQNGGYYHHHHGGPPPPPPPPVHHHHHHQQQQQQFNNGYNGGWNNGGGMQGQVMYGHHNWPGRR